MQLTPKDLGAMKMPLLALAIAIAASFAMVAFSSNQRSQSEKQYRESVEPPCRKLAPAINAQVKNVKR